MGGSESWLQGFKAFCIFSFKTADLIPVQIYGSHLQRSDEIRKLLETVKKMLAFATDAKDLRLTLNNVPSPVVQRIANALHEASELILDYAKGRKFGKFFRSARSHIKPVTVIVQAAKNYLDPKMDTRIKECIDSMNVLGDELKITGILNIVRGVEILQLRSENEGELEQLCT